MRYLLVTSYYRASKKNVKALIKRKEKAPSPYMSV